jgi:hypothetical protein
MNPSCLRIAVYDLICIAFAISMATPGFAIKVSMEAAEPLSGRTAWKVRSIAISKALGAAVQEAATQINPSLDKDFLQKLRSEDIETYVKAYRIINETSSANEYYKIALEVDIDSTSLKNRIRDSVVDKPITGKAKFTEKPSISVTILQNPDSNPIVRTLPTSDIEREISTILVGSGYRVVPGASSDVKLEAYVGIKSTETKLTDTTFNTLGYVFIRASNAQGKVVTEVSDSSYSTGRNLADTALEVLKRAGAGAAKKVRSELSNVIESRTARGTIEVEFMGLKNYVQYETIDEMLARSIPDININGRVFSGSGAVSFILLTEVAPDELAKSIQRALPSDLPFILDGISHNKIEFRATY